MAEQPNRSSDDSGVRPDKKSTAHHAKSAAGVYGSYGLGIEFILAVLLPGALGYWIDSRFGSRPLWMLVGGGVGFAAGLFRMLRQSRESMR